MCTSFLIVRSKDDSDAPVRLQSDAVLRGLKDLSEISASLVNPSSNIEIENDACVLFHFDDLPAIAFLEAARKNGKTFVSACFGCDIHEFSRYLPSYNIADLYLMPTCLHRKILASQFYKPVYYFPEAIDPIAGREVEASGSFPIKNSTRMLWFGYPGNFNIGMASLAPIIRTALESQLIQSFSLILNESDFSNDFDFPTAPFRRDLFRQDVKEFDYCILSHFALDLSLNSYIKSPNKLITALMAGLVPIASDTPSYSKILREFGLDNFLFESPAELAHILRNLNPVRDSQQINDSGIVRALSSRYSAANLANELLAIVSEFQQRTDDGIRSFSPSLHPSPKERTVYFTEHLKDLMPSLLRATKARLSRSNFKR